MTEILISERITGEPIDQLAERFQVVHDPDASLDPEKLARYLPEVRAWIVRNKTQVTAELLALAPKLQVVARAGVGLDNIDTAAAKREGIVVTYTPRENSVSVAELTLGLMLAWSRKIARADQDTRAGGWNRTQFMGAELAGQTLGIIGLGTIGQLVAERARAFGMNLLGFDPFVFSDHDPRLTRHHIQPVSVPSLLAQADVITYHIPLNDLTRGIVDAEAFAMMKPTALLINTARGEIIDEQAMIAALQEGRLGGAALDVREIEPPNVGVLESMPNVILTPHIGAFTRQAQARVVAAVAEDVTRVLNGEPAKRAFGIAGPERG